MQWLKTSILLVPGRPFRAIKGNMSYGIEGGNLARRTSSNVSGHIFKGKCNTLHTYLPGQIEFVLFMDNDLAAFRKGMSEKCAYKTIRLDRHHLKKGNLY
jgi:hypothetical protein